jgi:hypothetical protein
LIDATDPQYQVSANHPPNKEATWPYPAEKDGWIYAHDGLRNEISMWIDALDAIVQRNVGGELRHDWELKNLRKLAAAHFTHIHSHHRGEDNVFVPAYKMRFSYPKTLETDHDVIEAKVAVLEATVHELKVGESVAGLLRHLKEYQALILPHLQMEEDVGLPLQRAYFTQKELAPLIQKAMGKATSVELGSFIYALGVDKCRDFLIQENIPGFVWYIDLRYRLKAFMREFVKPIESLKSGVEPVQEGWLAWIF